jgi:hypothetical protein
MKIWRLKNSIALLLFLWGYLVTFDLIFPTLVESRERGAVSEVKQVLIEERQVRIVERMEFDALLKELAHADASFEDLIGLYPPIFP